MDYTPHSVADHTAADLLDKIAEVLTMHGDLCHIETCPRSETGYLFNAYCPLFPALAPVYADTPEDARWILARKVSDHMKDLYGIADPDLRPTNLHPVRSGDFGL